MDIFNAALLAAAYWITVIEAATLNYIDAGFQSIRIAKFRAPVCQYVFKQRKEPEGIKALLQVVKCKPYRAFGAAAHQECKEQLLSGKIERQQRLP